MPKLDVIIPVHNEADNFDELVERLTSTLSSAGISHTLIFVDDYSTDSTKDMIRRIIETSNNVVFDSTKKENKVYGRITLVSKKGTRGKATAILEGGREARSNYLAMIDGDLQYPPEALPKMLNLAVKHGICVANRKENKTGILRKFGSRLNQILFENLLFGLKCDTQSGLKVFKKEIIDNLDETDVTPWTLDIPLLLTAKDLGYKIATFDVEFQDRKRGVSKIHFFKAGFEIAKASMKLKFRKRKIIKIPPKHKNSSLGAGVAFRGQRFITHTLLDIDESALITLQTKQKLFLLNLLIIFIFGLIFNWKLTVIFLVGVLSTLFFIDFIFTLYVLFRSLRRPSEIRFSGKDLKSLKDKDLPVYTVLCPMYKEAAILPHFIEAINEIDWPKEKLDVILLLEEDDEQTLKKAQQIDLPFYFRTLVVPHSLPKTKPKACNYGLAYAKGEYIVIYDAEDKPDPLQLKKAYIAFASKVNSKVVCLQSKLNYYNSEQNLLTRLFTAEYSLWFDLILPGLQILKTNIPLGGTSNHFKTRVLRYLGGWDPFNVTEDCDLGTRLFKHGFQTAVIDSTTFEEANSKAKSWLKQRSRWIKGYLQTYFVHTRDNFEFIRTHGIHAFIFQLVIGARMVFMLVNPVLWIVTISYFVFRAYIGETIESLYPTPIFYMAVIPMIFGNFTYLYNYMIACAKRDRWDLVKYIYLIPFYWVMASVSAFIAFYQLIVKPHYWEKTEHGLHLVAKKEPALPKIELERLGWGFSNLFNLFKRTVITFVWQVDLNPLGFKKPKLGKNLNPIILEGSLLVLATGIVNLANFFYNAYLGRKISVEDFGTVSLTGSFLAILGILTTAIGRTVTYKSGYFFGKFGKPALIFWKRTRRWLWPLSLSITVIWLLNITKLSEYFKTSNYIPLLLFTPVVTFGFLYALNSGFLSGSLKFADVAVISIVEAFSKLLFAVFFVEFGMSEMVYLSVSLSIFASFLMSLIIIKRLQNKFGDLTSYNTEFPKKFFGTSLLTSLSYVIFLSSDVVLAKFFLSPYEAGNYSLLSLSGKMVYLMGSFLIQFINPIVSKKEGAKEESSKAFYKLLAGITLGAFIGYLIVGIFGKYSIPFLFGPKANAIVTALPLYTFGMACFTIGYSIVSYHQARKHYIFALTGFLVSLAYIVYTLVFHSSFQVISQAVGIFGIIYFIDITILHVLFTYLKPVATSITDFLGLFTTHANGNRILSNNLRILILNWRDTKHVWGGGAEVYIHELAKRWVFQGHKVTVFCGNDGRSKKDEFIDGVRVVRRGGFYLVYFWALIYYLLKFRGKYDIVIDCENGIPFFTPLFVGVPKVLLLHHVHQEVFRQRYGFPFSNIAEFLEGKLTPFLYKNIKKVTVSESSRSDMIRIGLGTLDQIDIVNPAIEPSQFAPRDKTKHPSILYLGRLKPWKSLDTVIFAMESILKKFPNAKLTIAGFGETMDSLQALVAKLGIIKSVDFLGKVSESLKVKLLGESWVFVYPSTMEGWGISAIEANASGTAVVASDVPGLRDSVKNPETGFLVRKKDANAFAEKIEMLVSDEKLRSQMERNSIKWAHEFTWDKSAAKFLQIINLELAKTYQKLTLPVTISEQEV